MNEFIAALARDQVPFRIYSPGFGRYLFVSGDTRKGDNLLEAHPAADEQRNYFVLQDAGGGRFRIFNPTYGRYLFVSRDTKGGDNLAEAHDRPDDARNEFTFEAVGGDQFRIYNPSHGRYLFVSYTRKDGDNLVEAHAGEERTVFQIQPSFNYRRWMELTPGVLDQPLRNVCLPATHDSGSWAFVRRLVPSADTRTYAEVMGAADQVARLLADVPGIGKVIDNTERWTIDHVAWPTILGLATTTHRAVAQQLTDGIRCLDLRVFHDDETGRFHTWHGAVGPELGGILDDLAAFLASTSSELVYVTMGHFEGFSSHGAWQAFHDLVAGKLGAWAYQRQTDGSGAITNDPFQATVREVLSQGGTLRSGVILVTASHGDDHGVLDDPIFFHGSYSPPDNTKDQPVIAGRYEDTDDRDRMLAVQASYFQQASGRPYALYLTLTPGTAHAVQILAYNTGVALDALGPFLEPVAATLKKQWRGSWTTLQELAAVANRDLISTVTSRFQAGNASPNAITFLYTDFYYSTPVVDLAIAFSRPRPAANAQGTASPRA